MRFDWPQFLRQHKIEYVTAGPNTAKFHVSVKCPFCGEADPSQHMGISLRGYGWGCLRNSAHRGKSYARLVQQLLHCSPEEARRITGTAEVTTPTVGDFEASYAALRQTTTVETRQPRALSFPKEFKPLMNGSPFARPFIEYLEQRGYRYAQIEWLAKAYNLHYATQGLYAYRIIIPIYDRYGELLSWTARTIQSDVQPRYRTLRVSGEDDQPVARVAANHTVLGLPLLWSADKPEALVVVEGPFDALKVTAFGRSLGVYATCLFGLNIYPAQVGELQELAGRFERKYLLLDEDAELQRLRLFGALAPLGFKAAKMPPNSDDPGALSGEAVVNLALELLA